MSKLRFHIRYIAKLPYFLVEVVRHLLHSWQITVVALIFFGTNSPEILSHGFNGNFRFTRIPNFILVPHVSNSYFVFMAELLCT